MREILFFFLLLLSNVYGSITLKVPNNYHKILSIHDLDFEKGCELKQGYIGFAREIRNKSEFHLVPVFAVLNQKLLSLFENETANTLIKTLDIRYIRTPNIPKEWGNTQCFQVASDNSPPRFLHKLNKKPEFARSLMSKFKEAISGEGTPSSSTGADEIYLENDNSQEKFSENSDVFCATESSVLKSWVSALRTFHNCLISEKHQRGKKTKKLHDLVSEPDNPSFFDEEGVKRDLDNELLKLKQDVIRDKLQEEKERNRLENERRKIEAKTRKLEQQQRILSRALQSKAIEEEKIAEVLIKQEENYKRNLILEQTRKALVNETHKEKSMLIRQEEQLLKAEKSLQEQIKSMMVQSSYDFEKLLDYGECFKQDLTGGNTTYIKEMCYKFLEPGMKPNADSLVNCLDKSHFCEMCCDFFIGTNHETTRFKCKSKCDKVILPAFNVQTSNAYIMTVPQTNSILMNNNSTFGVLNTTKPWNSTLLSPLTVTNSSSFVLGSSLGLGTLSSNVGFVLDGGNKIPRDNRTNLNSTKK